MLRMLLTISAAVATIVPAAPALGQNRQVVITAPRVDEVPTRRVSYADLNLTARPGQTTLNRRVSAAVRDVCVESVGLPPPRFLEQQCRSHAWASARPQIARAVLRAQQIAAFGSSSIAAGSISISLQR